jgi:hypothetical protein
LKVRLTAAGTSLVTDLTAASGRFRLVERRHRLEEEEVDPALEKALGLLPVGVPGLLGPDVSDRGEGLADRPDGAGHEGPPLRRLAGDPRALPVDRPHLGVEPVGPELEPVGAERVGLDDVGAGLEVLVVDLADEAGVREVELVEAAVQEDPARVEHRAHGPVEHERPGREPVEKRRRRVGRGLVAHSPQFTPMKGRQP